MLNKAIMAPAMCLLLAPGASGQSRGAEEVNPRPAFSAGMGVIMMSARDVVDLVNATALPSERVAEFHAAAEFFGAASYPLSADWILKFEYAFLAGSLAVAGALGPADFGVTAHMPSLIAQYVLTDRGAYNLKLGAGGGYYVGTLSEKYLTIDDMYSGSGAGVLLELEANTAFGDHLFAYLGGNLRWSFIGPLTNAAGVSPGRGADGSGTTLNFFGAGARLGFSYLF